jgi:SAM-dependent methyltransferase
MPGNPRPFDPYTPNPARIYDYWLGGHDNYEADRKRAGEIEQWYPSVRQMARNNRAFTGRAVTWAATSWYGQACISQFLDLGSGFPGRDGSIHSAARAVIPDARVAYVDHDPEVCDEASLILDKDSRDGGIAVICADLRDPATVLTAAEMAGVADPRQPLCVLLALVLHLMPAGQAGEVAAGYVRILAPGSLVVISVPRVDDPVSFREVRALWPGGELHNHARSDVAGFFAGLQMVPPGLVVARGWRGGMKDANVAPAAKAYVLGGAGRKPLRGQHGDNAQGAALRSTRTRAAAITAS